ncbi:MAG: DNA-directed RNA polymerase subunit delta [Bacillota bacterium]
MIDVKERSLVELAESILKDTREPVDLYELFDLVLNKKGVNSTVDSDILNKFYSDITTSAKFIYMGNNTWDLKRHQKIELWEKDGSHYHEYKEVEDSDMEARLAKQAEEEKAHQDMLERRKQEAIDQEARLQKETEAQLEASDSEPQVEITEDLVEDSIIFDEIEEDTTTEETVEPSNEKDETDIEYTEEDEEEYNKYMDMYEDEYDK